MVLSIAVNGTDDSSVDGCKVNISLYCTQWHIGLHGGSWPRYRVWSSGERLWWCSQWQQHKIKLSAQHATQLFEGDHWLAKRYWWWFCQWLESRHLTGYFDQDTLGYVVDQGYTAFIKGGFGSSNITSNLALSLACMPLDSLEVSIGLPEGTVDDTVKGWKVGLWWGTLHGNTLGYVEQVKGWVLSMCNR